MSDLVSVVIPAFGRGDALRRSVLSALDQRDVELEVVVVDDCSPEPLEPFVRDLAPRVRVVRHSENRGPGAARNRGVEAANGELIAFLDADDEWVGGKLAAQLALFAPGSAVISDYVAGDSVNRRERIRIPSRAMTDAAYCFLLSTSTLLVRRGDLQRVGGFPVRRDCAEDWVLHARLLRAGVAFRRVAEPLAVYHWSAENTTASHDVRIAHALGALECLVKEHRQSTADRRRLRGVTYGRVAQMAANRGDLRSGVKFASKALMAGSLDALTEVARVPTSYARGSARRFLRERPTGAVR